jgi:hypothetical protein
MPGPSTLPFSPTWGHSMRSKSGEKLSHELTRRPILRPTGQEPTHRYSQLIATEAVIASSMERRDPIHEKRKSSHMVVTAADNAQKSRINDYVDDALTRLASAST